MLYISRRFSGPLGAQRAYEPLVVLVSAVAAFVLGGLSLSIYVLQGGGLLNVNPNLALVSPVAIELLIVPLALGIGWLEPSRFHALRSMSADATMLNPRILSCAHHAHLDQTVTFGALRGEPFNPLRTPRRRVERIGVVSS
jgi:hypothetical protein